jgi:hypothetical protein
MAYDPGPLPGPPDTPAEEAAYRDQLAFVIEEKKQALADPGPSWREWFLFSAMKWYLGLAFLIGDAWIVVTWFEVGVAWAALATLVAAIYLEYLAYRVLWTRPPIDRPIRATFQRSWHTPVQFGRWTPEAELYRAGRLVPAGPDPREFL